MTGTSSGFDLYTNHANLVVIFEPLAIILDLGKAAERKVLRWAVHFSAYNYTCIYINGLKMYRRTYWGDR